MTQSDTNRFRAAIRRFDNGMLKTSDRIEALTGATAPDTANGSSDPDTSTIAAGGSARFGRVLIACLVAEIAVVAIGFVVLAGSYLAPEAELDPAIDSTTTTSSEATTIDATESFLHAWRRSLEHDHRATGTLTRTALGRDALFTSAWPDPAGRDTASATVLPYRHGRLAGRTLTQIGELATIVEPVAGHRTCVRQTGGFACTAGDGASDDAMAAIEPAVTGTTATHRVLSADPKAVLADFPRLPADIRCWETRSVTDGVDQRWGRRAQFCFHDPSGAAVFRRILGTTRVEVLVVESVSETVTPADVDPA